MTRTDGKTFRSFIALSLPDHVKQELVRQQLVFNAFRASFPRPDTLHITLFFLGDCLEGQLEMIEKSMDETAHEHQPFVLGLNRIGAFPGQGRGPRVIWSGLCGDLAELKSLWSRLRMLLREAGIKPSGHRFSPHITLARMKQPISWKAFDRLAGEEMSDLKPCPFKVTAVDLFTSRLTPEGACHTLRHTSRL